MPWAWLTPRTVISVLLAAIVAASGFLVYRAGVHAERARCEAVRAIERADRLAAVEAARQQMDDAARETARRLRSATDEHRQALARRDAAAAAARADVDRLRDSLAAAGGGARTADPGAAAAPDGAAAAARVALGECAGALVEVARNADAYLAELAEWRARDAAIRAAREVMP